jgi:hypothetical protein
MGTLNIMMRKVNAAPMANKGTCFALNVFLIFLAATAQKGRAAAYPAPHVMGPR